MKKNTIVLKAVVNILVVKFFKWKVTLKVTLWNLNHQLFYFVAITDFVEMRLVF
jgi:hypothetical protein